MSDAYTDQLETALEQAEQVRAELVAHLAEIAPDAYEIARQAVRRRVAVERALTNAMHFLPWESRQAQNTMRSSDGGLVFTHAGEYPIGDPNEGGPIVQVDITVSICEPSD
jgi:hypothetical protein